MLIQRTLIVGTVSVCLLLAATVTGSGQTIDRDCSEFSSQAEAQEFFDSLFTIGLGDPHELDADSDGIACEHLPAPYSAGFSADQADEATTMPTTGTGALLNSPSRSHTPDLIILGSAIIGGGVVLGGLAGRRFAR